MRRLVLGAVIAAACGGSPTRPDAAVGQPFDLRVGQSATVSGGLTVRFDSVLSDSRCPIDAICVRAGEAVVALTLSAGGSAPAERDVQTDPPDRRSASYLHYQVTLTALFPYPRSDRQLQPSDYVATLVAAVR